ncbi:MAG: type II toxin-antitoxin system RelB/DinJ family antitoxin [Candidatus Paceibacterota bacterium]
MKNAVINLKTDPKLKSKAMKVADTLGVSLSAVLNNELRRFSEERTVEFREPLRLKPEVEKELKETLKKIRGGKEELSPVYNTAEEFLTDLRS